MRSAGTSIASYAERRLPTYRTSSRGRYTLWREESAAEIDPGENRQPTVAGPRSGSSRVPRRGTRPTSP